MSECTKHEYSWASGEPPCPETNCPNGHSRDVFISFKAKLDDADAADNYDRVTWGDERVWIRRTERKPGYRGAIWFRWQEVKPVN